MLLLHLKADKELNILFVLHIFLQIIAVLALLEFHIALAALDDRTCRTCGKWSLQVLGLQGKYSLQGQQVRSSLHSPAQGPRDFPDVCGDTEGHYWQLTEPCLCIWAAQWVCHLVQYMHHYS